jgi:hypothetical protein
MPLPSRCECPFHCSLSITLVGTDKGIIVPPAERFPGARCSHPADQEALRIKQLVEFVEKSRRMAVRNPLLLADVGYYEAELAASRRCLQSVAAR